MIVVDGSVLIDALIDDGGVGGASRAALQRDPHWAAPAHLTLEVASAIRGRLLGGKIMLERAAAAVDVLGVPAADGRRTAGLGERTELPSAGRGLTCAGTN